MFNSQKLNILNSENYSKFEFSKLYLYGGKFLTNEVILKINEKWIDICKNEY